MALTAILSLTSASTTNTVVASKPATGSIASSNQDSTTTPLPMENYHQLPLLLRLRLRRRGFDPSDFFDREAAVRAQQEAASAAAAAASDASNPAPETSAVDPTPASPDAQTV
ncbi:hypothetical protein BGX29_000512 [Mortierella sp. GBA35]|nr:hypothetical protein BGX29_000512 [Mortierella sp. GBA35]